MQLKVEMQEVLLAKEDQEEVLRRRERELTALKGALKEEVAAHDQEVDKMKEQYEKEISRLQISLEEVKQVIILSIFCGSILLLIPCTPPTQKHTLSEGVCGDKLHIRGALTVCCFALNIEPYVRHQSFEVTLFTSLN